jgi:hypothetical protein
MRRGWLAAGVLALAGTAQAVGFQELESSPLGQTSPLQVLDDGRAIGIAQQFVPGSRVVRTFVVRWEGGAPETIEGELELTAEALVLSDDGTTLAATGTIDVPGFPTTPQSYVLRDGRYTALPSAFGAVSGISRDGQVIVSSGSRFEDGVVTPLPLDASGISGNGEVVFGQLANGNPAFSRSGSAAQEITLPDDALVNNPPQLNVPMPAAASSFDGNVLIGRYLTPSVLVPQKLFRWEDGETRDLGAAGTGGTGPAASDDGSVIVDGDTLWLDLERQLLRDFLSDLGLDVSGWNLLAATDVSPDGRTLVGIGLTSEGLRGWIAVIPEPGTGALLGLGLAALGGRSRRRRTSRSRTTCGHTQPLARGGETD